MEVHSIETGVGSMLRSVIGQIADGAGLGLARGAAGIGKTFALDMITSELEADGVFVVSVTASPSIGGSISAFTRAILAQHRIESTSTLDGVEALAELLSGYPFRSYGPRVVLIVDEAQELKPAILETIRSLWDRGTHARLGMTAGPAFGCILVGNDMFMGKGGNLRVASFRPLLSRVTHNIALPRPSRAEQATFAAALFPKDKELQALLQAFGEDVGNLRAQDVAARQARQMAGDGPVSAAHLRQAIRFMGGK